MQEFVIIGAGLAGASTAWNLALRGQQVTVLERTTPANEHGSSHGSARIFRYAYMQQLYCNLVVRARTRWVELERQSDLKLIDAVGSLNFGDLDEVDSLAQIMVRAGVEHELLTASAAHARWPQFHFDTPVLWQPQAGVLDPEAAIEAMLRLAVGSGNARVLSDWTAAAIEPTAGGYTVHSASGDTVDGTRVIVAAGGWLPELRDSFGLPPALSAALPPLEVREEQIFHFPYRERTPSGDAPGRWPTFIHGPSSFGTSGFSVYGLPGGRDGGFRGQKLAQFNGGRVIGSASAADGVVSPENRELMCDYVRRYMPGLEPTPYAEATCLFTNTPTEDFIFDVEDGVVIVSACSGHGAKFAPLLGELAADLAMDSGPVPAQFRLSRKTRHGQEPDARR